MVAGCDDTGFCVCDESPYRPERRQEHDEGKGCFGHPCVAFDQSQLGVSECCDGDEVSEEHCEYCEEVDPHSGVSEDEDVGVEECDWWQRRVDGSCEWAEAAVSGA